METKFTQGTWEHYNTIGPKILKHWLIRSDTGKPICTVADNDDAIANARLIAAAPELFKVARAYVELADFVQHDKEFNDALPGLRDALAFARAAIAKAVQS